MWSARRHRLPNSTKSVVSDATDLDWKQNSPQKHLTVQMSSWWFLSHRLGDLLGYILLLIVICYGYHPGFPEWTNSNEY